MRHVKIMLESLKRMKDKWDNFWKSDKIIYKPISIFKNLYFTRIKAKYIKKFISNSSILEIGCGDGKLLRLLPKENKIVGLDISTFAIKKAKKNLFKKNISLIIGDVFDIDFNDNTFDLVVIDGLIEHCSDKIERFIKEAYRVTNKGGYLIIVLTNIDFIRKILFKLIYTWDKEKIIYTKDYKEEFNKILPKISNEYKIEVIPKSLGVLMSVVVKKC